MPGIYSPWRRIGLLLIVCCMLLSLKGFTQDGSLDLTFNGTGKVSTNISLNEIARSVAVQQDGKIVVTGYTRNSSGIASIVVVRYNANGTPDNSFGGTGWVTTLIGYTSEGYSVKIQGDGKIVVCGVAKVSSSSTWDIAVVRYNSNGTLDTGFDSDGKVTYNLSFADDFGYSLLLQTDGKIIVAGTAAGDAYDFMAMRLNTNGSLDAGFNGSGKSFVTFGAGYNDYGYGASLQGDGKIVITGKVYTGTTNYLGVARLNADGTIDNTFNRTGKITLAAGNYAEGRYVTIQTDGKILVGGSTLISADFQILVSRFNPDGTIDGTFNSSGYVTTNFSTSYDMAYGVCTQTTGKIMLAAYTYSNKKYKISCVRYNNNGSLDKTFDGDGLGIYPVSTGNEYAYAINIQADGKAILAGSSNNGKDDNIAVVKISAGAPAASLERNRNMPVVAIETGDDNKVKLWPNPATNYLQVQTTKKIKNIYITDMAGKRIAVTSALANLNFLRISLDKLAVGTYTLIIEQEDKIMAQKFVRNF